MTARTSTNNELLTMNRIDKELNKLDPAARGRVLAWLVAKHEAETKAKPPADQQAPTPPACNHPKL